MDRAELVEWFDRWGIAVLLGVDVLIYAAAVAVWTAGNEPLGMGLGVFGLTIPLAIIAVALDGQ